MDFRMLGPFEVAVGDRLVALGGVKQRSLLVLLLMHRNEPVSTDRLVDELWGERPPETAQKTVQVYVSQLRKLLGEGRIETHGHGYALRVGDGELDLDRFEVLVERARQEGPRSAATSLREALSLFRGEPLQDLAYEPCAQAEIARMQELRLATLEERVDAELALGRHARLVPELGVLVQEQPLRERLRAQLMLALYRSGRQADALESYREGRALLDEQLGLEPGPQLRELEQRILQHDPSLAAPTAPLVERARRRRGLLLVVGGATLLLAAVVVAAVVELTGARSHPRPLGNEVAAIDSSSGRILSRTEAGTTPSNVVVGNGSVWVLDADDQTVSRIDQKTRRIVKTFSTGTTPTDLGVGEGTLWVGNAATVPQGTAGTAYTASVSRIDARSGLVTHTLELPGGATSVAAGYRVAGVSQLAVGTGAVWAIDPDLSVSRIDPATGKLVKRIPVRAAFGIAAGREGVWVVVDDGAAVSRIEPRTNSVTQTIKINSSGLAGIAVGAGSVWATDPFDGIVWRIEPGLKPITRTIPVGLGVSNIAFGAGAVWTANFIDGTVSRIDPRTNAVTRKTRFAGTPQGVAVGGGSAWVSVAGGTRRGDLPTSACAEVEAGGGAPDVLIASDLPLQGPRSGVPRTMAEAIRFVLRQHEFRAGRFVVGYQSCDDSTAQSGNFDPFKCASNAKAYGQAVQLVALIGTYNSDCAAVEIPIVNRGPGGALPMISPANTLPGLTRGGIGASRGEPQLYYPTGVRNFVRVVAPDDLQGAADAVLARRLGLTSVYVLSDGAYGVTLASAFTRAAQGLGVAIAGSGSWDPRATTYAALADRVARSGTRSVFLGGDGFLSGDKVVKALRARLGPRAVLIAGDGFLPIPEMLKATGPAAVGMYVSIAGVTSEKLGLAGRRFLHDFAATQPGGTIPSGTYVPEAAQAAEIVLQAIARSDGTRASVLRELRATRIEGGILGNFRFDANGDMTPSPVAIFRVTGGRGGEGLVSNFRGSVGDRVIYVPVSLLARGRATRR